MIKSSCKFIVILTWLKLIFPVFIFLTLLQTCQTSAYNESQKNPCLRKKHRKENFHDHSFLVIYRNKWCKYYLTFERHSIKSLQNQNNLHPPKKMNNIFHNIRCMMENDKKRKRKCPSDFLFSSPHKMARSSPTCRWYLLIISKQFTLRFSIPISSTATRKAWSLNTCSPISKSLWIASFNRSLKQPA